MIDISHALTVEGWMMESELSYLAEAASKSKLVVEVGSWMGRSTSAIAANTTGKVIAVDTWKGSEEHAPMLAGKPPSWLREQFIVNTLGFENLSLAEMESGAAVVLLRGLDIHPDMVFIDANHSYDTVKSDIFGWTSLLAEGGFICGHDYDPPNWMGIKQAVDECMPKFRVVPGTTIWTTEGV